MTLVVVQKKGRFINAVSDTGIFQNGAPLSPEGHLPKICILSPDTAVAFAGSSELALEAIGAFDRRATPPDTIRHFLEFHRRKYQGVDFILMFRRPSLRLIKIANGNSGSGYAHVAWIGDHAAFEQFQRYRNDREIRRVASPFEVPLMFTSKESERDPDNVTFQLIGALRHVLLDTELPNVFGQAVGVNNADGGFEYRPYTFILDELRPSLALPIKFLQRMEPELRESREYSLSCFTTIPTSPRQGVAFHFLQGKITSIYHGDYGTPLTNCRIVRNMNVDEFIALMRDEGCTDWSGQVTSRLPPSASYGIPADRWRVTSTR